MTKLSTMIVEGKEYGSTYHFKGDEGKETVPPLILVMGRYGEAATGGCDRISDVKSIRPVIVDGCSSGFHVLFEGIRMMNHTVGVEFCQRMVKAGCPYHIVLLRTTLEESLAGIRARQTANGGEPRPVVLKGIKGNITRARNYATKLGMVGAKVHGATRDEAPGLVVDLLKGAK
jgi:hypothetical protein